VPEVTVEVLELAIDDVATGHHEVGRLDVV